MQRARNSKFMPRVLDIREMSEDIITMYLGMKAVSVCNFVDLGIT